jgi:mRNA interferase RelE/StbE
MEPFEIRWKRSAAKELKRLPQEVVLRITRAVEGLRREPFPAGVRKILGAEHTYRIRVGDYRLLYTVLASILVIEIVRVGHRKDVYE